MSPLYTIIIPHHNSTETLKRLLNSIPTSDSFLVIVIDDCSDQSEVKELSMMKRSNVTYVFLKECRGAGVARTKGLQLAQGEWILFADSDDYYLPNLEKTLDISIKSNSLADIIIFNIDHKDNNSLQGKRYYNYISNFDGTDSSWIDVKYRTWTPWAKLFKRSFIQDHHLYFEPRKKGNDCFFVLNAVKNAKSIILEKNIELYHLSYSPNSLSHSKNNQWDYMFDVYDLWMWRYRFFRINNIPLWKEYNIFYLLQEIKNKFGLKTMIRFLFHSFKYKYNYFTLLHSKIGK